MGGVLTASLLCGGQAWAQDHEWDIDLGQMTAAGTGGGTQRYGEVIAAGDVTGDGVDDLVIAAPGAASDAGEVSIIFGSLGGGRHDEADIRNGWLSDTVNGDEIGASLLVEDVNGDGTGDLLVGSPQVGSSSIGEVWVFYGPLASAPTTAQTRADADVILQGDSGDDLGSALDFDADQNLLAIGASGALTNDGTVYVIDVTTPLSAGTYTVSAIEDRTYTGTSNERLGYSVAFTPYGLAMSAPFHRDGLGNPVGRVHWLAYMGSALPASGAATARKSATATGSADMRKLGLQVVDLDEVNDSGEHLLGIVAEEGDAPAGDVLFWATEAGSPVADVNAQTLGSLGSGLSSPTSGGHDQPKLLAPLGDYDGDGYHEFAYSDANVDLSQPEEGAVFVMAGASGEYDPGNHQADQARSRFGMFNDGRADAALGISLTSGDFNGDGRADIAAGWRDLPGPDYGVVRTWYGPFRPSTGGTAVPQELDARLLGTEDDAFVGVHVEGVGDVNCDGVDDVAIGSPYSNAGKLLAQPGEVFIAFGPTFQDPDLAWDPTQIAAWFVDGTRITGLADGDTAGFAHGVGDLDGDGCDEVVVGATGVDNGAISNAGAAYLFYGSASVPAVQPVSSADATFALASASTSFAWDAIRLDDLDGDGRPELAMSAQFDSSAGTDNGAVYLYKHPAAPSRFSGSYAPRTDADCRIDGWTPGGRFGVDMVAVDMDDDSTEDLAVGASSDNDGRVYVWTDWPCGGGSATISTASDIRIGARYPGAQFGWSLAKVGPLDMNGNLVDGLAVSAPFGTDPGGDDIRVAVIPGNQSAGGVTSPGGGFEICADQVNPNGWFGYALASGNMSWDADDGDLKIYDQDGALELFIGSPVSDGAATADGRVFAFHGHDMAGLLGTSPPTCAMDAAVSTDPWWTVQGDQASSWLGASVSTADLNRDGFDDIIIGQSALDIPPSGGATGQDRGQVSIGLSTQDVP